MLRQALPLGAEVRELAGLEVERLELAEVITQQFEARFAILRRRGGAIALLAQLGPGAVLRGDRIEQLAIVTAQIEQLALRGALHQRLIFHLAVDIDERLAKLTQCLHRQCLAVDVGARAAVRADYSPQHYGLIFVLDRLLGEPGARSRVVGNRKRGGDLGAVGAMPNDFSTGATASGEQQGVDQDRLAGAGFAGEHRQAGGELQLGGIDDCEIADLDVEEHGARQSSDLACDSAGGTRSPRPQRNLERRMRK